MTRSDQRTRGKSPDSWVSRKSSEEGRGSGSRENSESEGSERVAAQCMWSQRCKHGCGRHRGSVPGPVSYFFSYLSGSQKTFPVVLPVNGAWLKTGRSQQSKEPVSTRSCAREQMNSFSCPETPPTPSLLPKPWPCLVITPMCQATEPNPDRIQQPLVLRSDLLDSSRR